MKPVKPKKKKGSKARSNRARRDSAQEPVAKRANHSGMKKGQSIKNISPDNISGRNQDLIVWGRSAYNEQALGVFKFFYHQVQKHLEAAAKRFEQYGAGNNPAYSIMVQSLIEQGAEQLPNGVLALRLDSRADTSAYCEVTQIKRLITAIEKLDHTFFRDLADLIEIQKHLKQSGNLATSPEWLSVLNAYRRVQWNYYPERLKAYNERVKAHNEGKAYKEVTESHLPSWDDLLTEIDKISSEPVELRQIQRAVKALGLKLRRGKPGPKPDRKKSAGKT